MVYDALKVDPFDLIEEQVIGGLLLALRAGDGEIVRETLVMLPAEAFQVPRLRSLFRKVIADAPFEDLHEAIEEAGGIKRLTEHIGTQHGEVFVEARARLQQRHHHRTIQTLGKQLVQYPSSLDETLAALERLKGSSNGRAPASRGRGPMTPPPGRPVMFTLETLMAEEIPDLRWVADGLIPEGATLLVSRPKLGKSWLLLQTSLAVATGGRLAGIPVERGEVLYLALEDSKRRLQSRVRQQLAGEPLPSGLTLATSWPRFGQGGAEAFEAWLRDHPAARFVAVDTLTKTRPPRQKNGDPFAEDYAIGEALKSIADRYHVGLVIAHHDRKADATDWVDRVSGTLGLAASMDAILLLRRVRGQYNATLAITGRDLEERELAIQWDPRRGLWSIIGSAEEFRQSEGRCQIRAFVAAHAPVKAKDVADALNRNPSSTRWLLAQMVRAGELTTSKEGYGIPQNPSTQQTSPSTPTSPTIQTERDGDVGCVGELRT